MMQYFNKHTIQCFLALYCMLSIGVITVQAQKNLVLNGDLESYTYCPYTLTGITNVMPTHWYYACRTYFNENGYLNSCANGINIYTSVPSSYYGYQVPHSGNGYVTVDYLFSNRTYLQTKLRDSLQKNKKYYCEFFISKYERAQVSCNNHGMLFTRNAIYPDTVVNTCGPLNIVPQILPYGNPIISDTMNWIKISGIYTARGGEQYITIGNHAININTNYIRDYPSAKVYMAQYLIDDVSVIPLDSMCLKADAGRDTTIKVGDSVFIGSYTNGIDTIKWFNGSGQLIDSIRPGFWLKPTSAGTYMYVLQQTVNGCFSADTVWVNVQALPLKIMSYELRVMSERQVLNEWTTANEINVSHYNIERSTNAQDFTIIGKVKANNKSSNEYRFEDNVKTEELIDRKTVFYRVVGVDYDGRKTFSIVKSVELKVNSLNVSVFPNPAKDVVNVVGSNIKEVKLFDMFGREIASFHAMTGNTCKLTINNHQLVKGLYVVQVILTNGTTKNEKIIVQ